MLAQSRQAPLSIVMSVRPAVSVNPALTERIFFRFMLVAFIKICRENPNLLQLQQKRQAHNMINAARLVVANDCNLP